ncbi:MAG: DUF2059 domain-containing protein [Terriglobales bacterium]
MKKILVLLFFALPVLAQSDAPATREDVQKLFGVMHVKEEISETLDGVRKQQRSIMRETLKSEDPSLSDARLASYDQAMDSMLKDMPIDGMLEDMIPIYQKHFNHADLAAMTDFYASPTGQKALHEMPALTTESMQASYGRMQKQMDAAMQKIKQMAAEDQAKQKQTVQQELKK